ncbi:MAG: hypothetical protein AAGF12_13960 [Myxococcota bacterium]
MRWIFLQVVLLFAAGCSGNADNAEREIRDQHVDELKAILVEDFERTRRGVQTASERFVGGFDPDRTSDDEREQAMRTALRHVQLPPRGIPEFVASPMSFLAAIGKDGVVIARDVREGEEDRMRGQDYGERYEVVRRALTEGVAGYELAEFPAGAEGEPASWSMMFVAPVRVRGEVQGAIAAGIPLWRMAQKIGRQIQLDHASETGLVIWVYAYKGDDLHHFGTAELLDPLIPDGTARRSGLDRSPHGFTGEIDLNGRMYGFGVLPTPRLGADDVGFIIVRSDPV